MTRDFIFVLETYIGSLDKLEKTGDTLVISPGEISHILERQRSPDQPAISLLYPKRER